MSAGAEEGRRLARRVALCVGPSAFSGSNGIAVDPDLTRNLKK